MRNRSLCLWAAAFFALGATRAAADTLFFKDGRFFDVPKVGRFGVSICYDLWFPETARTLAALGGVPDPEGDAFWTGLRDRSHPFFAPSGEEPGGASGRAPAPERLWRISVPSRTPPLELGAGRGGELINWGGGERWVRTGLDPERLRARVAGAGGHASVWHPGPPSGTGDGAPVPILHPLPDALHRLHERLKEAFDPGRILNPGRLYRGL